MEIGNARNYKHKNSLRTGKLSLQSRIQEDGLETICIISLVNKYIVLKPIAWTVISIGGSSKDECERAILDVQN